MTDSDDLDAFDVVVSAPSRHGRRKLHTFSGAEGLWFLMTPLTHKQRTQYAEMRARQRERDGDIAVVHPSQFGPPTPSPWRTAGQVGYAGKIEAAKTIDLGDNVKLTGSTLIVVLEAMKSGQRPEVDLGDIRVVLSQLGSEIAKLSELTGEQRQHAEAALYAAILRRCTTV